jgi:hypothetical protein
MDGGKEIMENKSLFEIQSGLLELITAIEEAGGECTPEQEQQLIISRAELQHKGLNYVHYIKKLEADLELAKVYEEQVDAWKKRKTKTIERLKETLLDAVKMHGTIETDIFKIGTRKSESVEVLAEDEIPMFYYTTQLVKKLDKVKVKEDLKKGEVIPGVELRENKNLSIK